MPFMPHKVVRPKNILMWLLRGLAGLALVLLRLPFALVAYLCFVLAGTLCSLIPIAGLRRLCQRFNDAVSCRLLLFSLGFWWISAGYVKKNSVTVSRAAQKGAASWPPCSGATSGSLIIATLVSWLDILYLTFRFSPVFAFPLHDAPKGKKVLHGKVLALSPLAAIGHVTAFPNQDLSKAVPLASLVDDAKQGNSGPVVLFAEGVSSNGRGILPFLHPASPVEGAGDGAEAQGIEGQPWVGGKAPECFACSVRYPFKFMSGSFTVGSVWGHTYNLLSQVYNMMDVVYLDPRTTEIKKGDQGLAPSLRTAQPFAATLREALRAAISTPQVPVKLVVPRAGVTNEGSSESLSAVEVKRKFRTAFNNPKAKVDK